MPAAGWFVTGTDTGVGKTLVSTALLQRLRQRGLRVAGMKPVATGCTPTPSGLHNEDALRLLACSTVRLEYAMLNPYAFEPPIAPHIAAERAGVRIETDVILAAFTQIATRVDRVVVEGVGGWLVPLNETELLASLAERLALPVILVVGVRLGCLNHALLTVEAILRRGLNLAGWVANCITPADAVTLANITSLQVRIPAPLLGIIPWLDPPASAVPADCLSLPGEAD